MSARARGRKLDNEASRHAQLLLFSLIRLLKTEPRLNPRRPANWIPASGREGISYNRILPERARVMQWTDESLCNRGKHADVETKKKKKNWKEKLADFSRIFVIIVGVHRRNIRPRFNPSEPGTPERFSSDFKGTLTPFYWQIYYFYLTIYWLRRIKNPFIELKYSS